MSYPQLNAISQKWLSMPPGERKLRLTPEALAIELHYDEGTGEFTRKRRSSFRVRAGERAGFTGKDGYVYVRVLGLQLKAHRLAWLIVYGTWPQGFIDHINGVRSDNRISNLRDVDSTANSRNICVAVVKKNGLPMGVHRTQSGRFEARISADKKTISLGRYATADEAHAAYVAAKLRLHPEARRITAIQQSEPSHA